MKKFLIIGVITVTLVGLIALSRFHPQISAKVATNQQFPLGNKNFGYKDGRYTGQTVDVGYGPVQVQAIIKTGAIVDIKFLQMPNDKDRTIQVTNMAKPLLVKETLAAQNADIDIVSGATQTTEGYIQSLQDALDQAKG